MDRPYWLERLDQGGRGRRFTAVCDLVYSFALQRVRVDASKLCSAKGLGSNLRSIANGNDYSLNESFFFMISEDAFRPRECLFQVHYFEGLVCSESNWYCNFLTISKHFESYPLVRFEAIHDVDKVFVVANGSSFYF